MFTTVFVCFWKPLFVVWRLGVFKASVSFFNWIFFLTIAWIGSCGQLVKKSNTQYTNKSTTTKVDIQRCFKCFEYGCLQLYLFCFFGDWKRFFRWRRVVCSLNIYIYFILFIHFIYYLFIFSVQICLQWCVRPKSQRGRKRKDMVIQLRCPIHAIWGLIWKFLLISNILCMVREYAAPIWFLVSTE